MNDGIEAGDDDAERHVGSGRGVSSGSPPAGGAVSTRGRGLRPRCWRLRHVCAHHDRRRAVSTGSHRHRTGHSARLLAGSRGFNARRTRWICASSRRGAGSTSGTSSTSIASTSSASPVTSKTEAALEPRSLAGCRRSSASTATPKRKTSSNTRLRCTWAGHGSTTSHKSRISTATSSAPSSSPPHVVTARPCTDVATCLERSAGVGSDRCRHRRTGPRTGTPDADSTPQGRQDRNDAAGATGRPSGRSRHCRPCRWRDLRRRHR